jgi:hypothetical protein
MKQLLSAAAVVSLCCLAPHLAYCQAASAPEELRRQLTRDLSTALLGAPDPVSLGAGRGWRTVVLASPGAPLSPTISAFDPSGVATQSVSQFYENVNLYDRVMLVDNGFANAGPTTIAQAWEDLLYKSLPRTPFPPSQIAADEVTKWLFRQGDKIDLARGVTFEREPSEYMIRYREFELLNRILIRASESDEATWRLHPRLSQFASVEEAKEAIASDWVKFGFKTEVEAAQRRFADLSQSEEWITWLKASARFRTGRVYLDANRWVPQTILYPAPSAWLGLSSWLQLRSSVGAGNGHVVFQLARIKVVRPWLSIDDLLDGGLKIDWSDPRNANTIVSEGDELSFDHFPAGTMSVMVDELLIARDINWLAAEDLKGSHPLGLYKYPTATNLVAYVVRVLPKLP